MMEVPFPKTVLNVTLTPSQGKYTFDPVSKVMSWDVGRIDTTKLPNIKGNVCIQISQTFIVNDIDFINFCYISVLLKQL